MSYSDDWRTRYEANYLKRKEARGRIVGMTPRWIERHIQRYARKKAIFDRHLAGETYAAIAQDLGVSRHNVVRHATEWRHVIEGYPRYMAKRDTYLPSDRDRLDRYYLPLVGAGLL